MKRKYSPQLIWGYLYSWIEKKYPDRKEWETIKIFFYVRGREGAYFMHHSPKLYWDDDPNDGYFGNTDQSGLETDSEKLGEVLVFGLKKNLEPVLFPSYQEFLKEVGFQE